MSITEIELAIRILKKITPAELRKMGVLSSQHDVLALHKISPLSLADLQIIISMAAIIEVEKLNLPELDKLIKEMHDRDG